MTTTTGATTTSAKPARSRKRRKRSTKMLKVLHKPDLNGTVAEFTVPPSQRTPGVRSKDKMTPAEWRGAYDIRIREMLDALGATHAELGDNVTKPSGETLGRTAITNWLRGTQPNIMQFNQIAEFVNRHPNKDNLPTWKRTAAWFAYGLSQEPVKVLPDTDELGYSLVSEVAIEGPTRRNRRQLRQWGLGTDFINVELGASQKDIVIVKSNEDSQGIEYGDRMVVDCGDAAREPSPPGKFIIWNGFSASVAAITLLPPVGRRPKVKVVTASGQSETDPDKVEIIGRIRGVWKKI